jgi:hypothetical protein
LNSSRVPAPARLTLTSRHGRPLTHARLTLTLRRSGSALIARGAAQRHASVRIRVLCPVAGRLSAVRHLVAWSSRRGHFRRSVGRASRLRGCVVVASSGRGAVRSGHIT